MTATSKSRRIRCLVCKNLVYKDFSDSSPYSVKKLQINNKHGCICSTCVKDLYNSINLGQQTDASRQHHSETLFNTLKRMPPIPVTILHTPQTSTKQVTKIPPEKKFACLETSLDSYLNIVTSKVFGQDEAARMLLYTIYYNQFVNLLDEYDIQDETIRRNHVLLYGHTGVGKTFLATTIAKTMNIPYALCDATSITSAAYIGGKVEEFLERLYRNAGQNLELAENGILLIDEIDKKRVDPDKSGKDPSGEAVQQELLKILEPSIVHLKEFDIDFNTKNLTVIMMGAFVGLDEIIAKRLNKKVIGFKTNNSSIEESESIATPDDFIEYGMIPEFIGRTPILITMRKLSKSMVIDIFYSILNNLNIIFKIKDFDLIIDDLFIDSMADKILKSSTGARDIYSKIFHILYPALYRIFQSNNNGICQIDALGNTDLLVLDTKRNVSTYHFDSLFTFEEETY